MGNRRAEQSNHWYRRTEPGARGPLCAFMPLATVFLCQAVMLQSLPAAWEWMMAHPFAALWSYVVLLLLQMCLERMTTSLFFAVAAIFIPCFLLAVASYLKTLANGVPLLLSDLTMIGQTAEITGFLNPQVGIGGLTWLSILIALILLFLVFLWTRPLHRMGRLKRLLTAGGLALALVTVLLLPVTGALMDAEEEGENQAGRNDRLGVLAGMYAAARKRVGEEPDEYTEDNMNRILLRISADAPRVVAPQEKPNVVVILSESFFDPTRLPNITYSTDPVPNYHALARKFPSGRFATNAYAGGTGLAEMEILTGVPAGMVEGEEVLTTISAAGAYDRIPSIVKAFIGQGYETAYVHSHTDTLYGRTDHIPALGFQTILFRDDFTVERTTTGGYVSDDTFADQLIAQFEKKEGPIFLYGLSMENHQPYRTNKFDEPSPVEATSHLLEGDALKMTESMLHGIYDADASLGKLIDYFSKVEEPTILVFMGDHLPRPIFGENDTLYDRLGYSSSADTMTWSPEELQWMLETDYLVWNNYGAELDVPETLSTAGIGSRLLDWAGLPKPLYFYWVDTAMESMRIYRDRLFITADGVPYHEPPAECEAVVKRFRTIVYDILYGEHYAAQALTGSTFRQNVKPPMPEIVDPTGEEGPMGVDDAEETKNVSQP